MNILMIVRGVPTKRYPQWGCFEKDQAEALSAFGHKVVCLSVDRRFLLRIRNIGITHKHMAGVDYYNSFYGSGRVLRLLLGGTFRDKIMKWQYRRLCKRVTAQHGMPDVIYSHFFFNTYWGVYLKEILDIPLVGIEHAGRFNNEKLDCVTYDKARFAFSKADAIVAVSETLRRSLKRFFNIDSVVVNNVVNDVFMHKNLPARTWDQVRFISVGTLGDRKGFSSLIEAFSKVCIPQDGWTLKIIGDGPQRELLEKQIKKENLETNIYLCGRQPKNIIAEEMAQSDVFVLVSENETFGVVYIEAMSVGLPVIATTCGGPEEFVKPEFGVLLPVGDEVSLIAAIEHMYIDYASYDRKYIAQECKRSFGGEAIAKKLTTVFKSVISNYEKNKIHS